MERELERRRADAVERIHSEEGLEAVRRLAAEAVVPWSVGVGLADSSGGSIETEVLPYLDTSDPSTDLDLAQAFFARRFVKEGWTWLTDLLAVGTLTDLQRARLLIATRENPRSWEIADEQPGATADEFWRLFSPYGLGQDFSDLKFVCERLTAVGRVGAVLRLVSVYARDEGADQGQLAVITADAFEVLLQTPEDDPEIRQLAHYDFEHLFSLLERHVGEVGTERVAGLEWAYLPALGYQPEVPSLHRRMALDPAFFVEIVSCIYRRHSDEESHVPDDPEQAETQQRRATNAYRLLSSWGEPPGLVDGAVDASALGAWIEEAVRLLTEADRLSTGLHHVGQVLASAPPDEGQPWPPEVVRDFLEDQQSDDIESGLRTEIANRRGVTSRGLEDGGDQERSLAKGYRESADAYADRWPRTAAVLRALANAYESDARQNDQSAERTRKGLEH